MKITLKSPLKTLALILGTAAFTVGCATSTGPVVAQDRVYTRVGVGSDTFYSTYHFTESNGELGYRFHTQNQSQAPCTKGFIKLVKSTESDAVLYTTQKTMVGCENFRYVFPNNDLSAAYRQDKLENGEYLPVLDALTDWKSKGVRPSIIIRK